MLRGSRSLLVDTTLRGPTFHRLGRTRRGAGGKGHPGAAKLAGKLILHSTELVPNHPRIRNRQRTHGTVLPHLVENGVGG